ncbi:MAG: polyprenyl synthetase family protein [Chloroflexota bacterium]
MVLTGTRETSESLYAVGVADDVSEILHRAPITPSYRRALTSALEVHGRILSASPDVRWTRCVVTCCITAGGCPTQAIPIAAAIEVFMVALELLDDEEDAEPSSLCAALSSACLLNVSTGLLILAQQALTQAGGTHAATVLQDWALRSCGGQDADLGGPEPATVGLAESLAVTGQKSGSLVAAACQLGALAAGAESVRQTLYAQFGSCVGVVAQLANDLKAVMPGTEGNTDEELQRPTLPLVYSARRSSPGGGRVEAVPDAASPVGTASLALTWVVAEANRRRALDLIALLTPDQSAQRQLAGLVGTL